MKTPQVGETWWANESLNGPAHDPKPCKATIDSVSEYAIRCTVWTREWGGLHGNADPSGYQHVLFETEEALLAYMAEKAGEEDAACLHRIFQNPNNRRVLERWRRGELDNESRVSK